MISFGWVVMSSCCHFAFLWLAAQPTCRPLTPYCPFLPATALEEAASLVNEGDLLVTALSLGFATTALREQPACADTVVDKAR